MVSIRHELRGLFRQGRPDAARPLLERLSALAARDPVEHASVSPELERWRCLFGIVD
jgi:hypothetical protein